MPLYILCAVIRAQEMEKHSTFKMIKYCAVKVDKPFLVLFYWKDIR